MNKHAEREKLHKHNWFEAMGMRNIIWFLPLSGGIENKQGSNKIQKQSITNPALLWSKILKDIKLVIPYSHSSYQQTSNVLIAQLNNLLQCPWKAVTFLI